MIVLKIASKMYRGIRILNNLIRANGFWNEGCVLVNDVESMLLRDPPQNRFSTVSTRSGYRPDRDPAVQRSPAPIVVCYRMGALGRLAQIFKSARFRFRGGSNDDQRAAKPKL